MSSVLHQHAEIISLGDYLVTGDYSAVSMAAARDAFSSSARA